MSNENKTTTETATKETGFFKKHGSTMIAATIAGTLTGAALYYFFFRQTPEEATEPVGELVASIFD